VTVEDASPTHGSIPATAATRKKERAGGPILTRLVPGFDPKEAVDCLEHITLKAGDHLLLTESSLHE